MRLIALLLLASPFLMATSCSKKKVNWNEKDFLIGESHGEVDDKNLEEASGLVASVANPGYLWTHNDSGNKPQVFLLDEHAKIRLTCTLKGINNRDWEDITIGAGPEADKKYIYVGDIGDNFAQHSLKYVYRFKEPVLHDSISKMEITDFDTITVKLEDGKKDTETLMIDPKSNNLYVVSKREEPVYVYEMTYPFNIHDTLTAKKIFSLPLTQITAGDFSADGSELLLKNYEDIYYWKIHKGESLEEAMQVKAEKLAYVQEPQGEAIAWSIDGAGFFTLSEKVEGEKCILYYHKRNTER
jgi:hypothetical protein